KKTIVQKIISSIEKPELKFKPSSEFYAAVKINSKRFAKLLRGELELTLKEFKMLCSYFKIAPSDYLN
ncbi:MAG TPA: hypothetical protein VF411_02055, partial [Bacteroidia bacterium]